MIKKFILLLAISLVLLISACQYFVLPGVNETVCEPPNQLVQDISGNLVCVNLQKDELEKKVDQAIGEAPKIEVETAEKSKEEAQEEKKAEASGPSEEKSGVAVSEVKELPRKVVTEGELVSFPNLRATDADGDRILYNFTPPLNEKGQWLTKEGDAAEYKITITASDGKNTVNQDVILVVLPKNKPPVIDIASTITVKEGAKVKLEPIVSDPESDTVTVTYSGWMTSNERMTEFTDAGTYTVTITASDGKRETKKDVSIVVENVNRAPVLEKMAPVEAIEGESLTVEPKASDPDGDKLKFTFSTPLDSAGTWKTEEGDAGSYKVRVVVSDGNKEATGDVSVNVRPKNNPPELTVPATITVQEGDKVTIEPAVKDPEGKEVTITYTGWMRSNVYQTDYDDAGQHKVTVSASDGFNTVKKDVIVIVEEVNRPPVFDPGAFK